MTGVNWTEEQVADYKRRRNLSGGAIADVLATKGRPRLQRHTPGRMNKTEERYAQDHLIAYGMKEGVSWLFESLKLKLDDPLGICGVWYIPDFWIFGDADGKMLPTQEIVEVKGGFIREKGKLKFAWARQKYGMYLWTMAQWSNGKWKEIR